MYLKKQSDRISLDIKFDWHPLRLLLRSVYNFVLFKTFRTTSKYKCHVLSRLKFALFTHGDGYLTIHANILY